MGDIACLTEKTDAIVFGMKIEVKTQKEDEMFEFEIQTDWPHIIWDFQTPHNNKLPLTVRWTNFNS